MYKAACKLVAARGWCAAPKEMLGQWKALTQRKKEPRLYKLLVTTLTLVLKNEIKKQEELGFFAIQEASSLNLHKTRQKLLYLIVVVKQLEAK